VTTKVTDAPGAERYEARVDGNLAGFATYTRTSDTITFLHTVVEPEYGGQGIGSALARTALDEARVTGLKVVPTCSFIAGWITHHPDYEDLVSQPSGSDTD
jgi:predicted GNAT family acetyltransferase